MRGSAVIVGVVAGFVLGALLQGDLREPRPSARAPFVPPLATPDPLPRDDHLRARVQAALTRAARGTGVDAAVLIDGWSRPATAGRVDRRVTMGSLSPPVGAVAALEAAAVTRSVPGEALARAVAASTAGPAPGQLAILYRGGRTIALAAAATTPAAIERVFRALRPALSTLSGPGARLARQGRAARRTGR